ncbi:MAG TPA: anti-sigma factor [Thermoanaerobaculia bacterium]|nr:anti-sigma factor [Thermoanaerobaculia bacterium]
MDHTYIEESGLVERYHRGLLPPEEESAFEAHFVTCPECMEQLEMARGFQRGLKTLVAEEAVRAAVVQAGLFAWLARRGRLAQWGLALAALLIAAGVPSLWLSAQGQGERQAVTARIEAERKTAADLERRLADSEQSRTAERRELEAKLAEARRPSPPAPGVLDRPLANLPIVLLTAVRGEAGEPGAVIDLSRTGDLVALAVDAGAGSGFGSYRVTITGPGGGTVFRQAGLETNALETLMVTFPSSFFKPGDYRLLLEGIRPDGGAAEIGGYPFRVTGRR